MLLRHRAWFYEQVDEFAEAGGAALFWCVPWDGERRLGSTSSTLVHGDLPPSSALLRPSGAITARSIGSSAVCIAAKDRNGNIGDPWILIALDKNSAAYNTAPRYAVMSAVLFERERWLRPLLLEWREDVDPSTMTARFDVTVRGQGTTEGYHLREVLNRGRSEAGRIPKR